MARIHEGVLDARGKRVALVVSRFNDLVTSRLVAGAIDALTRHGASEDDLEIFKVPGAFEIGQLTRRLALGGKFDAVITLGAVIRGDTPHFDYIAAEAAKAVAQAAFESKVPVIFGILTTDNLEQALERAGAKAGNKGAEAAVAAIEMMSLFAGGAIYERRTRLSPVRPAQRNRGHSMKKRTKGRIWALQVAYSATVGGRDLEETLEEFIEYRHIAPENRKFTIRLLREFERNLEQVDRLLASHLKNWAPHRLAVLDRLMIRLGVTELLHLPDVPPQVAISEYVELAHLFGTDESPRFINGVLDAVFKTIRAGGETRPEAEG